MTGMSFNGFHRNLLRVNMATMLMDEQRRAHVLRLVACSNPSLEHRAWAAAHAERRRQAEQAAQIAENA